MDHGRLRWVKRDVYRAVLSSYLLFPWDSFHYYLIRTCQTLLDSQVSLPYLGVLTILDFHQAPSDQGEKNGLIWQFPGETQRSHWVVQGALERWEGRIYKQKHCRCRHFDAIIDFCHIWLDNNYVDEQSSVKSPNKMSFYQIRNDVINHGTL